MAAFQDTRAHTEQKVMVQLLTEIERNPTSTQRNLASELGIALGLMNQYLKSCVTKGWIRASQISPRRIVYCLTPEGFREKSHMVTAYLARSFTFFRDARNQCDILYKLCQQNGWKRVALVGAGDLTDIAHLVAQGYELELTTIAKEEDLTTYDVVIITDISNPQAIYDYLQSVINLEKILTLPLLHISRTSSHLRVGS